MAITSNTISRPPNVVHGCEVGSDSGRPMVARPFDGRMACAEHFVDASMAAQTSVPDVTGAQFDVARELLAAVGLYPLEDVGYQTAPEAKGEVLSQFPVPATAVDWVTGVELILSDGEG